ncbi:MAG: zinc-dependent metalloprotease [Pirellulales bacterium]
MMRTSNPSLVDASANVLLLIVTACGLWSLPVDVRAETSSKTAVAKKKPDFPPHVEVLAGYEKVVSPDPTSSGKKSLYTIWTRKKDGQMLAELPKDYASKKQFIAMTIASGDRFAGLQMGDMYVYWKRYDKRMALLTPNVATRSTGDSESKASVKRLFTDRVLLEVPIVTMGPGGAPVIDMDALLVGKASLFFGPRVLNKGLGRLYTIKKAKAFPKNVELAFEVPTRNGQLQVLHYSISRMPDKTGYKPRKADQRVGFFVTAYNDLGKYSDNETRVRNINRWNLEKADSKLKLSPPKKPIVFYIESTTPIRYRRWVRQGIMSWNKAFEKVGLVNAIEVNFQDARTGAHMEKDPEDVRYNFVRWLNNDMGVAIGPSRVHPLTGQILDADIILTDGWIRHYREQFEDLLPKVVMDGFSAQTLAWLANHPSWDPRIRLAPPAQRDYLRAQIARQSAAPYGGHPMTQVDGRLIGDQPYDGLVGRSSQVNGLCLAAEGKAFDVALMRMMLDMESGPLVADEAADDDKKEEKKDDKKEKPKKNEATLLDGMPESFIGPLLAHLVAHEVGHTLGLRHNFKASSVYSVAKINSQEFKGKKPLAGSVMDYIPVNINVGEGDIQGDYAMIGIGPYDMWAIEYGYSFDKDLKPILDRVAEPELQYATDEDTWGPDPLARRYDFGKDPRKFAENQMRLAQHNRKRLIDKFVKKGDSWSKARRGYDLTLALQTKAVSMMAKWVGGVHVYRDKKGDKEGRVPLEVVDAQRQREALKFVIDNTFRDEVYGLSPELLSRMTADKWLDGGFFAAMVDPAWPVHDKIMGLQASTLTMLMNPSTLQRIYDNEFRVAADRDMLTLPELMETLTGAIWSEIDQPPKKKHTARSPFISSLRRNLQREHLERLITLSMPGAGSTAAYKPVSDLSLTELRRIRDKVKPVVLSGVETPETPRIDPYTRAHLNEVRQLITKALDAQYIYNSPAQRSRPISFFH